MNGRCIIKDANGCEWMTTAQFVRAVLDDHDIKISATLVSNAKTTNVIPRDCRAKHVGKNTINYTNSIVGFFEGHPTVAPENLARLKHDFTQQNVSRETSPKKKVLRKRQVDEVNEDDELGLDDTSVAVERAKHEKIKREKAEFEFEIFKGNYMHIDDVTSVLSTIAIEVRQAIKAMIPRVYQIVAAMTSPSEVKELLERETDISLNHLERLDQIIDGSFEDSERAKQEQEEA